MRFDGRKDELEGRRGVKTHQRDEVSSMALVPAPQRGWFEVLGFRVCDFRQSI